MSPVVTVNSSTIKARLYQFFTGATETLACPKRSKGPYRLFLLSLMLGLSSCDGTLGTKSMTEVLPLVTVPGAPLPSTLRLALGVAIAQPNIDLGAGESFVSSVRVRNLTLVILDASDTDNLEDGAEDSFDFLSGLDVSIRATFGGELQELLIATLPDGDPQIGTTARNLSLTVVNSEADVLDFILAPGGYEIVLNLAGQIPPDTVLLSGLLRFRVGIGFY